jgi:hypothetical protein
MPTGLNPPSDRPIGIKPGRSVSFIGSANLSDTVFIVPDASDGAIAQAIAWVAGRIGRFAESDTLYPKIVSVGSIDSTTPTEHQFLFGKPTQNPAIYQLNSVLPLPFYEG